MIFSLVFFSLKFVCCKRKFMRALILAGGKGTRLRPLTVYTPKPVVPFLNRPFLTYQIKILRRAGIKNITLSLSYQPDKIEHIVGDGSDFGVNLHYVVEPNPLGTAGAYKFAAESSGETTIVLNGDILTDLDVSKAIKFHREKKADATLVLTPVESPSRFGLVETDAEKKVLRFREKPTEEEVEKLKDKNINAGIYILESNVADLIPEEKNYSFEYDLFPDLINHQKAFYAFVSNENYWRDIGTPKSYLEAHQDFFAGKINGFEVEKIREADIATAAVVDENSFIAEKCVIKPGAKVINSAIGAGVHLEEKVVVENSVIWAHTRVSSGTHINNSVVGRGSHIGRNVSIASGAILGDKTSLTDYTQI